jgi:ubiquinone/menaquinone biosynthesis C-methylase UbiE
MAVIVDSNTKKWIEEDGIVFFKKLGFSAGWVILDFGSGEGAHTIALSRVVGKNGKIYALERDSDKLSRLKELVKVNAIDNVETINQDSANSLKESSCDGVICYDVLHYKDRNERVTFYKEINRVLKNKGILSVYPKHHRGDKPLNNLSDMGLEDIISEAESLRFKLKKRFSERVLHGSSYNRGVILNFVSLNE